MFYLDFQSKTKKKLSKISEYFMNKSKQKRGFNKK